MANPWKEIKLSDYENHMALDSVYQLQTISRMMKEQLGSREASAMMILGVAGGIGLEHIQSGQFEKVYGVDINADYLKTCAARYPMLRSVFHPVIADLTCEADALPAADLLIANLVIEYIGYACFQEVIRCVKPKSISCIIQIDSEDDDGFVSQSPYSHAFDRLKEVHHPLSPEELTAILGAVGYDLVGSVKCQLPNRKKLVRLDYQK